MFHNVHHEIPWKPAFSSGFPRVFPAFDPCPNEDEKVAKGFAHGCGGKATVITVESKTAADISQAVG